MARSSGSLTFLDYNGEQSNVGFNLIQVAADGTNFDTNITALNSLGATIGAITIGTLQRRNFFFAQEVSSALPASQNAQRESKWLVTYRDTQEFLDPGTDSIPNLGFGKLFKLEVPTADLSLLDDNDDILYRPANAGDGSAGALFVASLEGAARSPYGGTIEVEEVRYVGRNL